MDLFGLRAAVVRVVTGNVAGRWHRLTEHDARSIVELLKDE